MIRRSIKVLSLHPDSEFCIVDFTKTAQGAYNSEPIRKGSKKEYLRFRIQNLGNYKINNSLFSHFRTYLQINQRASKLIWRPTISFENSLKYEQTYGNAISNNFWLWGDELHSLEYGEEFQLTFPCHFHLSKFPFDSHECSIYFGDKNQATWDFRIDYLTLYYGSSTSIKTSLGQEPLILDDLAFPFRFELEVLKIREKDLGGYNASMAGILIRIERESLGQLLSSYYYPTASFALLSMVSFLINPEVVCTGCIDIRF